MNFKEGEQVQYAEKQMGSDLHISQYKSLTKKRTRSELDSAFPPQSVDRQVIFAVIPSGEI